jgi:hypothetical protein
MLLRKSLCTCPPLIWRFHRLPISIAPLPEELPLPMTKW